MKHLLIVGGGFAGLNAAKGLGNKKGIRVTLIDSHNHHLFQPLLYQVATAGLSPADIAVPIRHILAPYRNITVLQGELVAIDPDNQRVSIRGGCELDYDYLLLACGVKHSYFGHEEWEEYAPGLKTIEQATEIRRRVLDVFEAAERARDCGKEPLPLTFVIVGGGPTGVELAGAIGEMSRYTLARDFRHINPGQARIILIEAGPRILASFSKELADKAAADLVSLGVLIRTESLVTHIEGKSVLIGEERLEAGAILWAAGVAAPPITRELGVEIDKQGRIVVAGDLSISRYPDIFVAGDLSSFSHERETPLPGLAPVALQQGRFVARNILRELAGKERQNFRYLDKGQLAAIGRNKAIIQMGALHFQGFWAWLIWVVIHIYYLISFENKLFVTIRWAWSFFNFSRGARLIVNKEWRFYREEKETNRQSEGH